MENFDHDINKAICEIPHAKDCIWLGRNIKQTFNAIKKERMTYGEFLDKKESSKKTKG